MRKQCFPGTTKSHQYTCHQLHARVLCTHRAILCYVYTALTRDCAQCNECCQSVSSSLGTGGSPSTGVPNARAADGYRPRACQEPAAQQEVSGGAQRSCICICSRPRRRHQRLGPASESQALDAQRSTGPRCHRGWDRCPTRALGSFSRALAGCRGLHWGAPQQEPGHGVQSTAAPAHPRPPRAGLATRGLVPTRSAAQTKRKRRGAVCAGERARGRGASAAGSEPGQRRGPHVRAHRPDTAISSVPSAGTRSCRTLLRRIN